MSVDNIVESMLNESARYYHKKRYKSLTPIQKRAIRLHIIKKLKRLQY